MVKPRRPVPLSETGCLSLWKAIVSGPVPKKNWRIPEDGFISRGDKILRKFFSEVVASQTGDLSSLVFKPRDILRFWSCQGSGCELDNGKTSSIRDGFYCGSQEQKSAVFVL